MEALDRSSARTEQTPIHTEVPACLKSRFVRVVRELHGVNEAKVVFEKIKSSFDTAIKELKEKPVPDHQKKPIEFVRYRLRLATGDDDKKNYAELIKMLETMRSQFKEESFQTMMQTISELDDPKDCLDLATACRLKYIAEGIIPAAQGKEKDVYILEGKDLAYLTPRGSRSVYGRFQKVFRGRSLRGEISKANEMKSALDEGEKAFFVADFKEIKEEVQKAFRDIGFVVTTKKATGDLERTLLSSTIDVSMAKKMGEQVLQGFEQLHRAGYVHGDVKPENILIYENGDVRIADFGHTRKLSEQEDGLYFGNSRYESPEGRLSQKGEVYGVAMVLIRIFENTIQQEVSEGMLVQPHEQKSTCPLEQRKGIERYALVHKKCLQTEMGRGWIAKITVYGRRVVTVVRKPSKESLSDAEKAIGVYIDAVCDKLNPSNEGLSKLLKDMTKANPKERPSMKEALSRYQECMGLVSKSVSGNS